MMSCSGLVCVCVCVPGCSVAQLHFLAESGRAGDRDAASFLMGEGKLDLDIQSKDGTTPLILAAKLGALCPPSENVKEKHVVYNRLALCRAVAALLLPA
jgi:hypothetical protein